MPSFQAENFPLPSALANFPLILMLAFLSTRPFLSATLNYCVGGCNRSPDVGRHMQFILLVMSQPHAKSGSFHKGPRANV